MSTARDDLRNARAFQQALVRMCLHAPEGGCAPPHGLARTEPPAAWMTYRRLVRARLQETIEHAFERLASRLGAETFCSLIGDFFDVMGPRSVILRLVPREFLAFLAAGGSGARALPPWALDLARFEWLELEAAYELDDPHRQETSMEALAMDRPVVVARATRLLDVAYRVHTLSREQPHEPIPQGRTTLCLYRDRTTFDVRVLELSAPAAALLHAARGPAGATLGECAKIAAAASGGAVDAAWLEAFAALVVDLGERGILLVAREPRGTSRST